MTGLAFSRLVLAMTVTVPLSPAVCAKEADTCFSEAGPNRSGHLAGFTWQIALSPPSDEEPGCIARVWSPEKEVVFRTKDHVMSIESISGEDLNGDGSPDLVFVGYSGGAHCCWTYWIVSLGRNPGLIKKFSNETPAEFNRSGPNRRFEIWTRDGGFDYFDDLSHAESVFPLVVLRLDDRDLLDVSSEHKPAFDSEIAAARRKLREFSPLGKGQADPNEGREYKGLVLTIVLDYLYSGREPDAWRNLHELWSVSDVHRLQRLIMNARKEGVQADIVTLHGLSWLSP